MGMRWLAAAAVVAGVTITGCGAEQTLAMTPSNEAPAATGKVDVSKSKDGNTRLDVKVEHLAPPEKLAKNASSYVVWMKPSLGNLPPQNIGALRVDKNLAGDLKTLTPVKDFSLFITAEQSATASQPSGPPVLETLIAQP